MSTETWQPIETAPRGAKDWAFMNLAWGAEGDQSTGLGIRWGDRFFAAGICYCLGQEKRYEIREVEVHPTHWMPTLRGPYDSADPEVDDDVEPDALMALEIVLEREQITSATRALIEHTLRRAKGG